ncbi:ABC transporter permease [Pseudoroseicyclus aestuarii]|uniref:Putative spermidine/putrescine transport system permease protein n=1 Tax=Pseudoroseicyclus aestuarii TaxID=1795041 RepID=A0A318SN69_9RHOB|nr:ABC transporter permease subunit [Pseudoroseicyclus aestuarii]PYE81403.1 putative spermidine/putrescine transport system permease protein [Pseudoroseicyclus aestuarii]
MRPVLTAALVLGLLAPLVPLALWSVGRGWFYPALLPDFTLAPWEQVLSARSGVPAALAASAGIAAAAVALALVLGVPAGRALGLTRIRGRALIELALLAPALVPGLAVALGLHGIFLRLGLTGTAAGVVLAHLVPVLPYVVLVMAGVFAGFDPRLEDQARSLGASPLQVALHVTLPAIWPGLLAAAFFGFLVSWSQYILTLSIGSGRVVTLPLLLYAQASAGRSDLAGAVAMIGLLPGLAAMLVLHRGLTGRAPGAA